MDRVTRDKWDRASRGFDLMNGFGPEKRWGPVKRDLFSTMQGRVLFLAVGTGLDIQFFSPGRDIVGIDLSPGMLEKAAPRALAYDGDLKLEQMDVHDLSFEDSSFDEVYTSCTFCSVPDPVAALRSLRRVLRPGGRLRMFEHTGSSIFPFGLMLHLMTQISRRIGPELNRDTPANVAAAGFEIREVHNVYLDVVRTIDATAPA